ncbi:DinB family protein [Streptomyces sp. NPDC058045]|uniref:DinB family protein n=1 Tax=Streptomyces sp. NPDC058045 TaxID=3346311 RepID=UPI0036E7B1C5
MTSTPADPARPAQHRSEPAFDAGERAMLEGWLDYHRATLALKCAGLTDAQLRTAPLPPSELSLMGLVRHLADVERHWFQRVAAGEQAPPLHYTEEDPDGEFHLTGADTWAQAEAAWLTEIAASRATASRLALDDPAAGTDSSTGGHPSLRWIHTHLIEEYARHNGHADLIREQLDGATGE